VRFSSLPFALPLRHPLATGAGVLHERAGELIRAEGEQERRRSDGRSDPETRRTSDPGPDTAPASPTAARAGGASRGLTGWGESTPVPGFAPPERFRAAALACARRDLEARRAGERLCDALARELGARARDRVPVNALLTAEAPDALATAARAAAAAGYRTLKLKIDGRVPERAFARVSAVRKASGPEIALRVDANRSLPDAAAALRLLRALAPLDLEYLEEPLAPPRSHPAPDPEAVRRLRAVGVPLAADESAADPDAARGLLASGTVDVLVLKPSVLGLGEALALAGIARRTGIRLVVTSALDGAVARAAALHLAAALPEPGGACGLATGDLLADDLAATPEVRDGHLAVPSGSGLGLEPDPAALARLVTGPEREIRPEPEGRPAGQRA